MHTKLATIALAAAAAAAPLAASAQSSVTVYGLLDMYLQYGKGDGSQTQIQSGGPQGSRLGFKGTEDLGSGLKALFQLEMGIDADTGASGQGGLAFGRQAYAGLSSNELGTLTLGRQYTPQFVTVDTYDAFGTGTGSVAASGVVSAIARANNAVVYASPTLGGFTFNGMASLGESSTAGQKSFGNLYSASVNYAAGPFSAAVATMMQKRSATTGEDAKYALVSSAYDFGTLKLYGLYQIVRNQGTVEANDRREAMFGVNVPVSAQGTVAAALGGSRISGVDGGSASQFSLGYLHNLSKRTRVYAIASRINNSSAATYTTDSATGAGPVNTVGGQDVKALMLGVRHAF